MKITVFQDVNKYALTSTLTTEQIKLVEKYRPDALTIKDSDGNPVFVMNYKEGKPSVSKFGITFGSCSHEGKLAQVVGDLPVIPEGQTQGEFIADLVGAAMDHINALEAAIPAVAAEITAARTELIKSVTTV